MAIAELKAEMHAGFASQLRWIIGLMIPLWLGSWGTVVAVLVKGA